MWPQNVSTKVLVAGPVSSVACNVGLLWLEVV